MNIKKNDIIELDIIDLNNLGCGVGRTLDGIVVFVKGAVTGDRVKTKIIKATSSYLVGRLEEIVISSPHRADGEGLRKTDCAAPQSCGGCIYRNIKYGPLPGGSVVKNPITSTGDTGSTPGQTGLRSYRLWSC